MTVNSTVDGPLVTRNMLIAARGFVASARVLAEASDRTDTDLETLYAIVLLCGHAAELSFKAAFIKFGGPPGAARYSVGPDLRRAAGLAEEWGYNPPWPSADQLLDQLSDAYLSICTRRYDTVPATGGFNADYVVGWTDALVTDVDVRQALAEKHGMPAFLGVRTY